MAFSQKIMTDFDIFPVNRSIPENYNHEISNCYRHCSPNITSYSGFEAKNKQRKNIKLESNTKIFIIKFTAFVKESEEKGSFVLKSTKSSTI